MYERGLQKNIGALLSNTAIDNFSILAYFVYRICILKYKNEKLEKIKVVLT